MESKQIGPGGYAGLAFPILATCAAPLDFAVMSFFFGWEGRGAGSRKGYEGTGRAEVRRGVAGDAATSGLAYPLPGHLCMRIPGRATPVRVGRIRRMR